MMNRGQSQKQQSSQSWDMEQLDMFEGLYAPIVEPAPPKQGTPETLDERFQRFHEANPHIFDLFVATARDYLRRSGRNRVGGKAIWEHLRWEYMIRSDEENPTLNNSYVSRYVRLAIEKAPDLQDAFELRAIKSKEMSM